MLQKNRIWRQVAGGLLLCALFCTYFCRAGQDGKIWGSVSGAADKEKELFFTLTEEEEDYLAGLRAQTIFAGVAGLGVWEMQDGVPCGVVAPLADVLHHEFGLELRVVQGTWAENRAAMQDGGLDLLVGVPAAAQGAKEGELPESGWYQSAWLYENPYVLVEYIGENTLGEGENHKESGDLAGEENPAMKEAYAGKVSTKVCVAYIEKDPVSEAAVGRIKKTPGLYFEKINTADALEFSPCTDEAAVLAALSAGHADAGIVPEDALFFCYPAQDFFVLACLDAYGSRVAVGVADEKLMPLLEILTRYLEETKEGEELRGAMGAQQQGRREEWVRKKEGGILKKLRARRADLQYAKAGLDSVPYFWHDTAGTHGELADFLAFVTAYTGLSFCEGQISGEEALQALEDGEILFVAGMPFLGDGQAYCFAGEESQDALVMVVRAGEARLFSEKDPDCGIKQEAIAQRYWGVVQEFVPLLLGTVFDGHVVGFPDEKKLLDAMQAGEISGMLLGRGSFDALLLGGEDAYAVVEGTAFPVRSGLAFSGGDKKAAGLFGRLWQFYRALGHGSAASGAGQAQDGAAAQYRTAYAKLRGGNEELTRMVWISGAVAAIFAVAFLWSRRRRGRKNN